MRNNSLLLTSRDVGTEEIKVNEDMIEPSDHGSENGYISYKIPKADKFKLDL
jgi:hypothetical protein